MNKASPNHGSAMGGSIPRPPTATSSSKPGRLGQEIRRVWAILGFAVKTFARIDGGQWAGAFAFNVFFSLFPLMILLVTIASYFIEPATAEKQVIAYMERYVPISGEMHRHIVDTIAGVINSRGQASAVALLILVWVALQCFTTLICATNRAWGPAASNWWRLPLKSLALFGITGGTVLVGMTAPVLMRMTKGWMFTDNLRIGGYSMGSFFIPLVAVFFGLSLFYKLAPRQPTRFAGVWAPALCATILLQCCESLFEIYMKDFATLNAVYGAFGGIMALLLWIYVSGCIFIFGACLCAGQAEMRFLPARTSMAKAGRKAGI
jgi:Ca2+-transporting ATPase